VPLFGFAATSIFPVGGIKDWSAENLNSHVALPRKPACPKRADQPIHPP
jgi:hypothetical protein